MSIYKQPVSDQRIAFEAWCSASHTSVILARTSKGYISEKTRVAWRAWQAACAAGADAERERICKAIKEEDDYCVTQGDYMLDSDDCIAVATGEWERPDYSIEATQARGQA